MPTKSIKSTRSNHSSRVRTINTSFDHDRLCRYLLSGNRRCQRTQTNTGSGLCILHDRHLTQLRDAQSEALGNQALGNVTDFNSAISIHAVLSRIVMLGLHRRYSTKEVSVFTYAMQSLRQTLEEAAYEIRHHSGLNSRDPLIARAIDAEPSLSQPDPDENTAAENSVGAEEGVVGAQARPRSGQASPTHTPSAPIIDPSDIADVLHSGYISNQSQESIDNLLNLSTNPKNPPTSATTQEFVGAQLAAPAEHSEITTPSPEIPQTTSDNRNDAQPAQNSTDPHPHANKPWFLKNPNSPTSQNESVTASDPNDGSIPYTHIQSYGGITVPLHGRLRIGPDDMSDARPKPKTPKPVKFFRNPRHRR